MFYYYFRVFNWFCTAFGMKKPFLLSNGQACNFTYWSKVWSVMVITIFIAIHFISNNDSTKEGIKTYVEDISDINDLIFNIIILIIDFFHPLTLWTELYMTFGNIFNRLKLSNRNLKMIALKLYVWIFLPSVVFIPTFFMEIFIPQFAQFTILIKVPGYLATLHLVIHLHLALAVLRNINKKLYKAHQFYVKDTEIPFLTKESSMFRYFLNINVNFMEADVSDSNFSIKSICKIYDDLITCVKLLEKLHGKQILCTIWMMFSGAVIGVTLMSCEEVECPWILSIRIVLPFIWSSLCCIVDDQLRQEVDWTEILIMKHLIDFKCDLPRKKVLETFKQLVSTNRLQFTAGSLFRVNYHLIFGTVMNVITYSIICIQLFLRTD
ncbi:uncharacterized protein LOC134755431 [Cydia strobilella]|uniref:uncharacterized protein LOC134755431 n=1 Tax=Cydia strobilella TaxID=1100964 RepID=UPI003003BF28